MARSRPVATSRRCKCAVRFRRRDTRGAAAGDFVSSPRYDGNGTRRMCRRSTCAPRSFGRPATGERRQLATQMPGPISHPHGCKYQAAPWRCRGPPLRQPHRHAPPLAAPSREPSRKRRDWSVGRDRKIRGWTAKITRPCAAVGVDTKRRAGGREEQGAVVAQPQVFTDPARARAAACADSARWTAFGWRVRGACVEVGQSP